MQNTFTYSVITGNISNSLKNEKIATGVSQCFCVSQWKSIASAVQKVVGLIPREHILIKNV